MKKKIDFRFSRRIFGFWAVAVLSGFAASLNVEAAADENTVSLYAGTISNPTNDPNIPPSEGIYRLELNMETGALVNCGLAAKAKGPSWVTSHPILKDVIYASAGNEDGTTKESLIIAFKKQADGSLVRMNTANSGGTCACHLSIHPNGKFACAANYCSGQVSFIELNEDGSLGKLNAVFQLEGKGPNAARQKQSYAHFVTSDPNGKFSLCCDLGGDQICSFYFDEIEKIWKRNPDFPSTRTASGAGPRHLAFAPNGKYVYVLNELSCTLDAFAYDSATGAMTLVESSPTLPPGYRGFNKSAAIDVSKDGKFLYFTNRGANLITVFAIDSEEAVDGAKMEAGVVLNPIQYVPSGGEFPRFAGLDPTGKFFIACNKKSHNVNVFRVSPETGKLTQVSSAVLAWCTGITY
ncbi:MAG: lactonase family protein [Planctomycetaceae bacterium]|nr:lactonase family protein [Planctomycetaceae bacterium]MBQ2821984.1 lactonase family protein [Thermoguttaceae bacterium]